MDRHSGRVSIGLCGNVGIGLITQKYFIRVTFPLPTPEEDLPNASPLFYAQVKEVMLTLLSIQQSWCLLVDWFDLPPLLTICLHEM